MTTTDLILFLVTMFAFILPLGSYLITHVREKRQDEWTFGFALLGLTFFLIVTGIGLFAYSNGR